MAARTFKARRLPDDGPRNGWYETLPPPPPARRVTGRKRVDFAVIGAGTCGCAAARRLGELRPDETVALVEAARVGYGTSGRNAGFMLDHHSHGGMRHFETARKNDRLFAAGTAHLRDLVQKHQIRCQWSDWGRIYVAAEDAAETDLKAVSDGFDALEVPWQGLGRDELEGVTGSRFYRRGVRAGGSALVQPAAMMRGLAATLPANVTLYEESPVLEIGTTGGFRIACPDGTIEACRIVLANHVFAEEMGILRHRIVPLASFASLTEPLSDAQMGQLGSEGEFGLLPANPNGSTVRLTLDRRILMRNSLHYARDKRFAPELIDEVAGTHRRSIARRWPDLGEVALAGTWGGILGFTRNEGAVFGEVRDGIWAVMSSDAAPMTKGAIAGKLLAEHICGVDSELLRLMLSLPRAALLPPDPILRFFVRRRIGRIAAAGPGEK
ncbi:MAG: FAD-binding oxidoreductase [Immundisolibacterales bacterium]|nr:FAD-binding oxidoreductase [Immundisolibacterales bacterium]